MGDSIEYPDVVQEVRGTLQGCRLRLQNNVVIFKNTKTGVVDQLQASDIEKAQWLCRSKGRCLKLTCNNDTIHRFDGLKETDYDKLSSFISTNYNTNLEKVDLALKGWNWGNAKFEANAMNFEVGKLSAFEIPLGNVSHSVMGKNEVTLEFHQNDDAAVSLVEMRFHLPPDANQEVDRVQEFHTKVLEKADIIQATGDAFAIFAEVQCLTPRGRYDIKIYPTFLQLHGKTYDYKIPYNTILRLFLLQHKDGRQVFFVVSMDPPIKQGQTRYPYLIMLFTKEEEVTIELTLTEEEIADKYEGKLSQTMSGMEYEVVSRVMKAVVNRKITVSGSFVSHTGNQSISCSYKAATGFLYPLERGFIFVHKPPMHIRFDEIANVNFARSAGSTRSFDFEVETKAGLTFTFVGIEKDEYAKLYDHVKNKKLRVKNIGGAFDKKKSNYQDNLSASDEDNNDAYLRRMKKEGAGRHDGDLDDDSDSSDEDFNPDKDSASSVAEEYDSNPSSSSEWSEESVSGSDDNEEKRKRKEQKRSDRAKKEKEKERRKKARIQSGETTSKRKRKKKKVRDADKPKRAATSYMLWLADEREKIKEDNPGASIIDITKIAGQRWKTAENKEKYEELAAEKREEYQIAMKEYKANHKDDAPSSPTVKKTKKPKTAKSPKKGDAVTETKGGSGEHYKSKEFISSSSSDSDESGDSDDRPLKKKKVDKKQKKPAPEKEEEGAEKEEESAEDEDFDDGNESGDEAESEEEEEKPKKARRSRRQAKDAASGSESEAAELPSEEEILGSPGSSAGPPSASDSD